MAPNQKLYSSQKREISFFTFSLKVKKPNSLPPLLCLLLNETGSGICQSLTGNLTYLFALLQPMGTTSNFNRGFTLLAHHHFHALVLSDYPSLTLLFGVLLPLAVAIFLSLHSAIPPSSQYHHPHSELGSWIIWCSPQLDVATGPAGLLLIQIHRKTHTKIKQCWGICNKACSSPWMGLQWKKSV